MTYPAQPVQPAPPAPQPVEREITGMLQGVEQRNAGWMRFLILEQGRQYPVKVDTKQPEIINAAMALMGQWVTAAIKEQQSTTLNPHNNQPYTNRFLNKIAPYGTALGVMPTQAQQAAGVPVGTPVPQQAPQPALQQAPLPAAAPTPQTAPMPQPGISGFDKDVNIMRQTASKVAANLIASGVVAVGDNPSVTLVEICEALIAYYTHGPLRFGVQAGEVHAQAAPQEPPTMQATPGPPPAWGGSQATYDSDPGPQDGQVDSLGQ